MPVGYIYELMYCIIVFCTKAHGCPMMLKIGVLSIIVATCISFPKRIN